MADEGESVAAPNEVLRQIVRDLTDNNPHSVERALLRAYHYPALRELIDQNISTINKILRGEISSELKVNLLNQFFGLEEERLNELSIEQDRPVNETDIARRAENLNAARENLERNTHGQRLNRDDSMGRFINRLVTNYTLGDSESAIRAMLQEQLINVPLDASEQEVRLRTERALAQALNQHNVPNTKEQVLGSVNDARPEMADFATANRKLAIYEDASTLLVRQAKNIGDTRMLIDMVNTKIDQRVTEPLRSATYQARADEAMRLPADTILALVGDTDPSKIFQRAGLNQTADLLAGQPIAKQRAMVVGFMLERAERVVDAGTLAAGGVSADAIKDIIGQMGKNIMGAEGAAASLSGNFSSVFSSFSQEIRGTDEIMTAYIQSIYQKILSPEEVKALGFDRFLVSIVNVNTESFYPVVNSSGHTILNWLPELSVFKKGAIKVGAGDAAGAAGISVTTRGLGGFFARWAVASGLRGFIGRIGVAVLGFIFSLPGWIIAIGSFVLPSVGRGISNLVGKFIGGEIGVAGYGTRGVLSAFGGATPSKKDTNATLLTGCGGCLFALAIPFLGIFLFFGAFLGRAGEGLGGGGSMDSLYPGGVLPPESMVAEITWCPVERGTVSGYRPNQAGTTHDNGRNAYDLGARAGQSVYASHTGSVYLYGCDGIYVHCANAHPDWKGYGNFVVLAARHEDGTIFFTHYAHLLTIDKNVLDGTVEAGEIIGTADNTGNSKGNHVHFEYRRGTGRCPCDLRPFLPIGGEHGCVSG